MAVAIQIETWLDPPLQSYFSPRTIVWHVALVDPVTKLPAAIPAGGALVFQWTQPPVQNTPQVVTPQVAGTTGLFYVVLPITVAMYGKLLLAAILTDVSGTVIDTDTTVVTVYPSGA